jgi:hypothetical protein
LRYPISFALAVTACGFAAVKLLPDAADAYRSGLGYLQWPFAAAASLPYLPPVRPVNLVADPSDLLALPALIVPLLIALGTTGGLPTVLRQRVGAFVLLVCSVALLGTSPAYPSVSDTNGIAAVTLSAENPTAAWEITLTASDGALPAADAIAGVGVTQTTGPNTLRTVTRDEIELTLIGLHPDGAVRAASDANEDEVVAELQWLPFTACDSDRSCAETYRLEARWLHPTEESLTVDVDISVSISYGIDAAIPSDAHVHVEIGPPAASP